MRQLDEQYVRDLQADGACTCHPIFRDKKLYHHESCVYVKERVKLKGSQTWWGSIVEAKANIAIGFGVAMASNAVILPAFGYPVTIADNLGITLVFTVISVVRQLVVRRFFNALKWGKHK